MNFKLLDMNSENSLCTEWYKAFEEGCSVCVLTLNQKLKGEFDLVLPGSVGLN